MKNNDCWEKYQIRKDNLNFGVNKKIEDKLPLSELKKILKFLIGANHKLL